jgi:RimJ/RimL family protein N-acetyltransferase
MRVDLCMNPDLIRALYDDPFVQDRYADSAYYGFIDAQNVFYVVGYDEEPFACAMCIIKNIHDIEVHLCIPSAAKAKGYDFCVLLIDWLYSMWPINRISTTVVSLFPQVGNFAKRLGFTFEGTARGACHRDGEYYDLHNYALLRGEPYGRRRSR